MGEQSKITVAMANDLQLSTDVTVAFKPLYTLYHTSGAITSTVVSSATNGDVHTGNGRWRSNANSFGRQPSSYLIDGCSRMGYCNEYSSWKTVFRMRLPCSMTSQMVGVALGQINLFHDKACWGSADIVIRADNSLRPSAAIGGVVNAPVDDPGNVEFSRHTG